MRKIPINSILTGVAAFFVLLFVFSGILSVRQKRPENITGDMVAEYAAKFISDSNLVQIGKQKSCSGFTSLVYHNFDIELPKIASEQFKQVQVTDSFLVGNLVFFSINSSQINHVGLILSDSIFVHSPGVNKKVRTENIKLPYWFNSIKGTGKLIN